MFTKEKTILLSIATFFVILFIWVVISVVSAPVKNPDYPEAVACAMDAKLCPDGSSVGRTGPYCEFEACPGESPIPLQPIKPTEPRGGTVPPIITPGPIEEGGGSTSGGAVACTMDAKMCPDGSYVGRTAPNCEFAPCPIEPSRN